MLLQAIVSHRTALGRRSLLSFLMAGKHPSSPDRIPRCQSGPAFHARYAYGRHAILTESRSNARRDSSTTGSTGLTRKRSIPASWQRRRWSSSPWPVMATIKHPWNRESRRNWLAASQPSIEGILMSNSKKSGRYAAASAIPAWPLLACRTSWPSERTSLAVASAVSELSLLCRKPCVV